MDSSSAAGPSSLAGGDAQQPAQPVAHAPQPPPPPQQLSRYESQKRRDWNTFLQYLRNHRPPLTLARCSGAHVIEFLKYLDQFGKTKVHAMGCAYYGQPSPPAPCPCPLRQAWGSLDALIGRLRAAYEESGHAPESNPFAPRAVRIYLREVRDAQAKARGIPYEKKKRKRTQPAPAPPAGAGEATSSSSAAAEAPAAAAGGAGGGGNSSGSAAAAPPTGQAGGSSSTTAPSTSRDMYGLRHRGLAKKRPCSATCGNSQGTNPDAGNGNSQRPTSGNSQGTNADVGIVNSQRVTDDQIDTQMSTGGSLDSNDGASGSLVVRDEPPKKARGRGKKNLTQLRVPPHNEKVMLKPVGTRQFGYVNYNPRDYKYGSQVGVIIRRLYPGMVYIRDEEGRLVEKRAAMSWHDYYCKKDVSGITYAKLVKCEFWRLFKVTRADVRKADRNLDAYLVKRVSDLIYQTRLDAVKIHAKCDDNQARTIHLTEEEYINSRLDWCAQDAWNFLSKYWTSERYMEKRKVAQASRLKSEDAAQNRGGSRPFGETQQLLEYKFGPEKAGTVNTYAVMKSGFKKVDSTGKSAPIPSRRAQQRLDNYSTRTQLPENSKDLDIQALYVMEHGMAHGRVPIADGCVDKQALAATAKSHRSSASTAAYQCMVHEYEQLKERNDALEQTNKKLNENNEILIEENGVNRELMLRIYEDLKKQPPADLMNRLANLDARRHQVSASSHAATNSLDMLSNANDIVTDDDDDDYNEMDDSNSYDDDNDICDDFDEDDVSDDLRGSEDDNISSRHEEEDDSDANGADISDN